jgi:hypothetical protein
VSTADLSSSLRSVGETLIRPFALQFAAVATVGHLLSLRNSPYKRSTTLLLYMAEFLLFPMLPLAQLLRQLRSAIALSFDGRRRGVTFYASACCRMYIVKSGQAVDAEPIIEIDPLKIQRKRALYDVLWLGRIVVLLALVVQYCGVVVPSFRRQNYYRAKEWQIDIRNLVIALTGLIALISSLAISLINTEWKIESEPPGNEIHLPERSREVTGLAAGDASEAATTDRSAQRTAIINTDHELARRSCNACTSASTPRSLPCSLSILFRCARPLGLHIPKYAWLSKAKRFYK